MDAYTIVKKPLITEKGTFMKEKGNYYSFVVDKRSTKTEIKKAIEEIFKVHVIEVKTVILPGKSKRFGRAISAAKKFKKAYIKIKPQEKIEIIEGV